MQKTDRQVVVSMAAVVLGLALMVYGMGFHRTEVFFEKGESFTVEGEGAVVREVTIGGVRRDESGNIRLTYTGKAPAACPT